MPVPLIFAGSGDSSIHGFRSKIEAFIVDQKTIFTHDEINQIYSTSVYSYAASNYRAQNLAMAHFQIADQHDNIITNHSLVAALQRDFYDTLLRAELSNCFWGRTLLVKERDYRGRIMRFRWLNNNLWMPDTDIQYGLKGFRMTGNERYRTPTLYDYVKLRNAIYLHGVDFRDDFDGVAPAEVAFLHAGAEINIAQTALSFFQNMAIPGAIIQPAAETNMRPGQRDQNQLVDFIRRTVRGARNFGRSIVTPVRWEWIPLQNAQFDQLGVPALAEQVRNAICAAFHVPIELMYPSASNYAQALEARRTWLQMWLVPRIEWYAKQFDEQCVKQINTDWHIKVDYTRIPGLFDSTESITTQVIAQLQAGVIDLYTAQQRIGSNPDKRLKDIYVWDGKPLPIDFVPRWWNSDAVIAKLNAAAEGEAAATGGLGLPEEGMFGGSEIGQEPFSPGGPTSPTEAPSAQAPVEETGLLGATEEIATEEPTSPAPTASTTITGEGEEGEVIYKFSEEGNEERKKYRFKQPAGKEKVYRFIEQPQGTTGHDFELPSEGATFRLKPPARSAESWVDDRLFKELKAFSVVLSRKGDSAEFDISYLPQDSAALGRLYAKHGALADDLIDLIRKHYTHYLTHKHTPGSKSAAEARALTYEWLRGTVVDDDFKKRLTTLCNELTETSAAKYYGVKSVSIDGSHEAVVQLVDTTYSRLLTLRKIVNIDERVSRIEAEVNTCSRESWNGGYRRAMEFDARQSRTRK